MSTVIIVLIILAALGAVAALGRGLYFLGTGKDVTGKKQNQMMWYRIAFQGLAILLVMILVALGAGQG